MTAPDESVDVRADATAVRASAWSLGGRRFEFSGPMSAHLPIGAPVLLTSAHGSFLGQVIEKADAGGAQRPRQVVGHGTLTARLVEGRIEGISPDDVFDDATVEVAPPEVTKAWLAEDTARSNSLALGELRYPAGEDAHLLAAGFNRHTFLCGQSGSGKTYSLGLLLEQLLLRTSLRIVVFDPNSDYVHLDEIADASAEDLDGVTPPTREQILVFRSHGDGPRLRARYGRLPHKQQGMVLGLDPLKDGDEFDLLMRVASDFGGPEYSLRQVREALDPAGGDVERSLARRIDNLGAADWSIWAEPGETPLADQLTPGWRAAILDLGELPSPEERYVMAASILAGLWARRHEREPVLIVIDEAHNICPQNPADVNQALAIEHTDRIAAEGRKYGLFLLVATQSPRKLYSNVLAQCENLLLMKTNSVADLDHLAEVFSHVPKGLISQATGFQLGEGLAAGRIVPAPQLFKSGRRLSPEGGADIPTTWARTKV